MKKILLVALTVLASVCGPVSQAQTKQPEDGFDYKTLPAAQPTEPKGKIEVVEFFSYKCPHCNAFEPSMDAWIKKAPADVVVKHVPAKITDSWVPAQRLYYALEGLGKANELHSKVYYAIHIEKQQFENREQIADWAEKQGIDRKKFLDMYNSFSVETKVNQANKLAISYKIDGVPTLVVGGRYVTAPSMVSTMPGSPMTSSLIVTDYLVDKVRKSGKL